MSTPAVLACLVCAPPLGTLLTGGLQAGVLVLGMVALVVLIGIARAVAGLLREDGRDLGAGAWPGEGGR